MRRLTVLVLAVPFVVEACRIVWRESNKRLDAWYVEQLRKAWRSGM